MSTSSPLSFTLRLGIALVSLALGAAACAPPAVGGGEGTQSDNQTSAPATSPSTYGHHRAGETCYQTDACEAGLVCLPVGKSRVELTCVQAVVYGGVEGSHRAAYANLSLLKQDPPAEFNADGVPVESYTAVESAQSGENGDFGFFNPLDDGIYIISALYASGETGQTAPLTLGELTAGKIIVTIH